VVDEDELYSALDWLAVRQAAIEAALAKRHLSGGTLVLCDVSSSYLEGRCCPLAHSATAATAIGESCKSSMDCFVSNGTQKGPRLGIEKGPLTDVGTGLSR
jgi:hypothetical protein